MTLLPPNQADTILDSSSDDDLDALMCGVDFSAVEDIEEDEHDPLVQFTHDFLPQLEKALICTDLRSLEQLKKAYEQDANINMLVEMGKLIVEGKYVQVLTTEFAAQVFEFLTQAQDIDVNNHIATNITLRLKEFVLLQQKSDQVSAVISLAGLLIIGIASLNLFTQANYTGPALDFQDLRAVYPLSFYSTYDNDLKNKEGEDLHKAVQSTALLALQADGDSPYPICEYAHFLIVGRMFLHMVGNSENQDWSFSVHENQKQDQSKHIGAQDLAVSRLAKHLKTAKWWCARAGITHERLLLHDEPSQTLWKEVKDSMKSVRDFYMGEIDRHDPYFIARIWIEWGLAQHFFEDPTKGKQSFAKAQEITRLSVEVTGSLGKRTKFQKKEVAQMVLKAASHVAPADDQVSVHAIASANATHEDFGGKAKTIEDDEKVEDMIMAGEAAYRKVEYEHANVDNILLEEIAFSDKTLTAQGNLQVIDQIILLALCLDVANSNPKDGLTNEQMSPYICRVLQNPNNWMVYSTGLLEKAWIDCERSHSRERAVLQMQALVDQHTTRLTVMQSSLKAIEEAAPAHERMQYLYSLVFPPRYSLRRGLAERYYSLGVAQSALEIFEDLEMWDEVVECYQILDKPKRATQVVKDRLAINPTPFMWCCFGDLTQDISCYEKAWELSRHRFARAKRSLGRHYFQKEEFETALGHMQDSVKVQPYRSEAWFMIGIIGMRTSKWNVALEAFGQVVYMDPEQAQAWGNIGSVHYRAGNYEAALSAFQEGLKHRRYMWQMWENVIMCALQIGKYGDAIYAFHQLFDLRDKHKRPVDHEMLACLVEDVVYGKKSDDGESIDSSEKEVEAVAAIDRTPPVSHSNYKKQIAMLLGRLTSTVTNNPKLWQVYAHYNDGMGRHQKALDCRLKECRSLQTSGWDTDANSVDMLMKACIRLSEDYISEGSKRGLYSCRMFLRGLVKKAQVTFADRDSVIELQKKLEEVEQLEAQATA